MLALTEKEWNSVRGDFPNLQRDKCFKTGEPSDVYNCIAFSIGITTQWIDPAEKLDQFKEFYRNRGFEACSRDEATVQAYAKDGVPKHGAKFSTNTWESKLGHNIRMTHPQDGLSGDKSAYGNVVLYFKPQHSAHHAPSAVAAHVVEAPAPAVQAVAALSSRIGEQYGQLDENFEKAWDAWKASWKTPEYASSSKELTEGPEFDALVAMGTSILPLVVNKLQDPSNCFACRLYNKLQSDATKKVSPNDLNTYLVLNNQAQEIIRLYNDQISGFQNLVSAWEADKEKVGLSSHSSDYTSGQAYVEIRDMGKEAVPLIMDKYATEPNGWWHELLHDIEHDGKSGANTFDKPALFNQWSSWFQGEEKP